MIYFDHAATTYPKPWSVTRAVLRCMERYGGNAGRGAHALSLAASELIYDCRRESAELFGADSPERVFFTMNTTQGLNTVLKGLLRRGDHALISDMEHNAVWRPLCRMRREGRVSFDVFPSLVGEADRSPETICARLAKKIRPNTRLIVCTHASNLCSATLPIREIGELCRKRGLLFVVDGAQSAGHYAISVDDEGIDALCVPGHKGLYGPQGCGMVVLGKGIRPETLIEGGNGIRSLEGEMSEELPERYEAGTLPTPAIAGLCRGIRLVRSLGLEEIRAREEALYERCREMLLNTEGITLYAPEETGGILLFNLNGVSSERVGEALNRRGICVRSGYHCCALGHRTLGTPKGGAVRISFGLSNRREELELFYTALRQIQSEWSATREEL